MIPLALVTGFLGSGKTTFLERTVAKYRGRRIVYLVNEFSSYYENSAKKRIDEMDPSALFTVYVIGIVSVKLVSDIIPVTAEEIYQKYYRGLERDPSILMVTWPEVVMRMA